MNKITQKVASTDEAWDTGSLGATEAHARPAPQELEAATDSSLGLHAISIRLPKQLIDAYKLIAAHHGVGYQPLMRDILQRYVPEGLKEVLKHHETLTGEVDTNIEKWKKAACCRTPSLAPSRVTVYREAVPRSSPHKPCSGTA